MSESMETMNRSGNAPGDWKVTELCMHCGLPIVQWDTGRWVHVRMGQLECSLKQSIDDIPKYAKPQSPREREKQYVIGEFYKMIEKEAAGRSSVWFSGEVAVRQKMTTYEFIDELTGLKWVFDKITRTWYRA